MIEIFWDRLVERLHGEHFYGISWKVKIRPQIIIEWNE